MVDTSSLVAWIAILVHVGGLVTEREPPFIRRDRGLPGIFDLNLAASRFDEWPDGMT
jgi:hypothetical protein